MLNIRQGDCLELMKTVKDNTVDLVLTDPPYGANYVSRRGKQKFGPIANDKKPFIDFIAPSINKLKSTGAMFIFSRWDVQDVFIKHINSFSDIKVKSVIIWDKGHHSAGDLYASYGRRYETIIFACKKDFRFKGKRPIDIKRFNRVAPLNATHPTPKPVDLLEDLIKDTTVENDTVLDCTMGSGSTGIACINTNRNFIGFELDPTYFNVARDRINNKLIYGD